MSQVSLSECCASYKWTRSLKLGVWHCHMWHYLSSHLVSIVHPHSKGKGKGKGTSGNESWQLGLETQLHLEPQVCFLLGRFSFFFHFVYSTNDYLQRDYVYGTRMGTMMTGMTPSAKMRPQQKQWWEQWPISARNDGDEQGDQWQGWEASPPGLMHEFFFLSNFKNTDDISTSRTTTWPTPRSTPTTTTQMMPGRWRQHHSNERCYVSEVNGISEKCPWCAHRWHPCDCMGLMRQLEGRQTGR